MAPGGTFAALENVSAIEGEAEAVTALVDVRN
jgi:hypothetical protein